MGEAGPLTTDFHFLDFCFLLCVILDEWCMRQKCPYRPQELRADSISIYFSLLVEARRINLEIYKKKICQEIILIVFLAIWCYFQWDTLERKRNSYFCKKEENFPCF